jgi:hypothetical protein
MAAMQQENEAMRAMRERGATEVLASIESPAWRAKRVDEPRIDSKDTKQGEKWVSR